MMQDEAHAAAGGDLCIDTDGDGCCDACGVSLGRDCSDCDGNGYHRAGCPSAEDTVHLASDDPLRHERGIGACGRGIVAFGDTVMPSDVTCRKCLKIHAGSDAATLSAVAGHTGAAAMTTASDLLGESPRTVYARAWRDWRLACRKRPHSPHDTPPFAGPRRDHTYYGVTRHGKMLARAVQGTLDRQDRLTITNRLRFWRKLRNKDLYDTPRAPLP